MNQTILIELIKLTGIFLTLAISCVAAYTSWRNGKKVKENAEHIKEVHIMVNSRMDQLLALTKEAGSDAGKAEEKKNPTKK